ncbi:MAG: hypothetical protein JSV10_03115 [Candidatus Zixiibacteriota bacterium]|nr:MAG: hypothetical protein JSV10_03115 [candidate division Zixibacteria bacterium]
MNGRRKTKRKTKTVRVSKKAVRQQISDLRLLELLISKFIEKLEKNGFEPKVQDALKAIQLKQKLAQTSEAEKIFWELIDQLKKEELNKEPSSKS